MRKPKYFDEFVEEIRNIPEAPMDATKGWMENRKSIRENALKGNLAWWEWPGIVRGGIFSGPQGYNIVRLPSLMTDPEWQTRWLPVLPDGLPSSQHLPGISSTAIGHAAHILYFEQATGTRISDYGFIFEFGAGYGSLARLAYRLGFRGEYVIHDLPEFAALQRMYLRERNIPVRHVAEPIIRPPSGVLSLAISLHAADESGPAKCGAFAAGLKDYGAMWVNSGGDPQVWRRAAPKGPVLLEPIPGPPGNYYIIAPAKKPCSTP